MPIHFENTEYVCLKIHFSLIISLLYSTIVLDMFSIVNQWLFLLEIRNRIGSLGTKIWEVIAFTSFLFIHSISKLLVICKSKQNLMNH